MLFHVANTVAKLKHVHHDGLHAMHGSFVYRNSNDLRRVVHDRLLSARNSAVISRDNHVLFT
jgi:hypothetical protein